MQTLRSIAALVVGVIVSTAAIMIVQGISGHLYPLPEGTDPKDMEALKKVLPTMPTGALVMVLLSWQTGAFLGGGVSALIAGRARCWHAAPIGVLVLLGSIFMFHTLPHPDWMIIAGLLLPAPMSLLAGKLLSMLLPPPPFTQTNPS